MCLCSLNTVLGLCHFLLWHIMNCYTAPFHSMLYLSLTGLSCAFVAVCSTSGAQKNAYLIKAAMHALAGDLVNAIDMLQQAGLKPQDAIDKQLDIFKRIGSLAEVQSEGKGSKMVLRLKKKIPQTAEAAAALAVALGQLNLKIGDFLSPDLLSGAAGGAVAGGEGAAGGGVDGGGAAADAGTDGGATAALAGGGGYGNLAAAPGSAAVAGGDGLGVFVDATL